MIAGGQLAAAAAAVADPTTDVRLVTLDIGDDDLLALLVVPIPLTHVREEDIHPTNAGHAVIAATFWQALR